jgi:uncharacterized protein (TIGR03382 family)
MRSVRVATVTVVAGLALIAAATPVIAADQAVSISGFAYSPASVTVSVGDSVTWTNNDGATHTATADGGSFDTGNIGNGASKAVTFATAGTFAYHCAIHSAMHGTVVVQAASGGATPPATDVGGASGSDAGPAGLAVLILTGVVAWLLARRRFSRT